MTCREEQDEKLWLLQSLILDAELAQYPDKHDKYRRYIVQHLQLELGWSDERASSYADEIIGKVAELRQARRTTFWRWLTGR